MRNVFIQHFALLKMRVSSILFIQLYLHLLSLGNVCGKCFDNSEMSRAKIHYRAQSRVRATISKFVKIMMSTDYRGR